MKTLLVTTSYLEPKQRYERIIRFLDFYKAQAKVTWDIMVLDNASPLELYNKFIADAKHSVYHDMKSIRYAEHYDRPSHLDYKYLWRAVHQLQTFFDQYDKIVYMDNDFYILKQSMIDYINALSSGWTTFWCGKYGFPETGCHIIVKGCKEYDDFIACGMEQFFEQHNKTLMEHELPVTHVEHMFSGDRYGETNHPQTKEMDYYAQNYENKVNLKFEM